jgi:hypothetical protein
MNYEDGRALDGQRRRLWTSRQFTSIRSQKLIAIVGVLREGTATVEALFGDYQDMVQREKTHPMRLIGAAGRISEATGSHDFIYSLIAGAGLRINYVNKEGIRLCIIRC